MKVICHYKFFSSYLTFSLNAHVQTPRSTSRSILNTIWQLNDHNSLFLIHRLVLFLWLSFISQMFRSSPEGGRRGGEKCVLCCLFLSSYIHFHYNVSYEVTVKKKRATAGKMRMSEEKLSTVKSNKLRKYFLVRDMRMAKSGSYFLFV